MHLEDLEMLVDVARCGSFVGAAKERNVDPSVVSRTIGDLERSLGVRLFQRTTRKLSLTEAGDSYLATVAPLLGEFERARDVAVSTTGKPRGLFRMTASVTFGQVRILPLIKELRERYPLLTFEFLFSDEVLDLVADRIDLAVRLAPAAQGNSIATKLMDTRYRVVASPAYLKVSPLRKPSDLESHRVLLFNIRAFRSHWLFRDASGKESSVSIAGDITLSPAGALREAALEGLGPALLPNWLVDDDIAKGTLVECFVNHRVTATTFDTAAWLVYPSRAYLPNKVRVVIDFLKEKFQK
jgi:DNA-binding transcriptional LysR family regulator